MADHPILAIHTYGSQRVKHPATHKPVSAYKIGYTTAASKALLALYGAKGRDVSSQQATYRYIQIEGETTVHHGYLLLNVTAEELARTEAVTRLDHRAGVYLWRDGKWFELPSSQNDRYSESTTRSGCPNFDPSGFRPVSPATGEKEAAVEGIRAEKSQRRADERPWWWLLGDTYPQREILKRSGARFSGKRRAWYYVGWELPDAIKRLISIDTTSETVASPLPSAVSHSQADNDAPCSDEEAERLPGVRLTPKTAEAFKTAGEAEAGGAILDNSVHQPFDEAPVETRSGDSAASPNTSASLDKTEPVRVFKPQPLPTDDTPLDEIQTAIVRAKQHAEPVLQPVMAQKRVLAAIGQTCVGELTGSITGNVWCYGYAVHEGVCVYVNMGGPRMAVEAIRAKLGKGDIVTCVPSDAPAVELTAGEGNTGMYHDFMQTIPEAKFTSLILCHEGLVNPNYGGKSTTFILRTDDAQAMAKLKAHITELVKVPVFDAWAGYLYQAGQTAMLVRPSHAAGTIDLLTVELDADAWTRLITGGIEQSVITLPDTR